MAALADLKGFLKAVLKLRNHKAFPPGSVPAELLKAVLFPSWPHRDRSKPGVGANDAGHSVKTVLLSGAQLRHEDISDDSIDAALTSNVAFGPGCVCVQAQRKGVDRGRTSRDGYVSLWTGVSSKRSAEGPGRAATRILPVDFWQHPWTKTRRGNSAPTRDILAPAESGHFAFDANA